MTTNTQVVSQDLNNVTGQAIEGNATSVRQDGLYRWLEYLLMIGGWLLWLVMLCLMVLNVNIVLTEVAATGFNQAHLSCFGLSVSLRMILAIIVGAALEIGSVATVTLLYRARA